MGEWKTENALDALADSAAGQVLCGLYLDCSLSKERSRRAKCRRGLLGRRRPHRTSLSERARRYGLEGRLAFARLLAPSRCFCSVGSVWVAYAFKSGLCASDASFVYTCIALVCPAIIS